MVVTAPPSSAGVSLGDELHARTGDLAATGIRWGGRLVHLVCFASSGSD